MSSACGSSPLPGCRSCSRRTAQTPPAGQLATRHQFCIVDHLHPLAQSRHKSNAYIPHWSDLPHTRILEDDGGSCQLGSRLLTMLYIFSTATSTCARSPTPWLARDSANQIVQNHLQLCERSRQGVIHYMNRLRRVTGIQASSFCEPSSKSVPGKPCKKR